MLCKFKTLLECILTYWPELPIVLGLKNILKQIYIYIFCIYLFIKTLTECLPNGNLVLRVLGDTRIYAWSVHRPLGRLGHLSLWNEFSCYLTWVELVTVESLGCCWQSPVISRRSWEWTSKWSSVYVRSVRAAAVQPALHVSAHRRSGVTCCNFPDVSVYSFFGKYDEKQKDSSPPWFTELLLVLPSPQLLKEITEK